MINDKFIKMYEAMETSTLTSTLTSKFYTLLSILTDESTNLSGEFISHILFIQQK